MDMSFDTERFGRTLYTITQLLIIYFLIVDITLELIDFFM